MLCTQISLFKQRRETDLILCPAGSFLFGHHVERKLSLLLKDFFCRIPGLSAKVLLFIKHTQCSDRDFHWNLSLLDPLIEVCL
jgi:hypothetical protein